MQEMTWTVSCAVAATEAASKERECSGPGADVSLRRATWGWARLEATMGRTDQQRKKNTDTEVELTCGPHFIGVKLTIHISLDYK